MLLFKTLSVKGKTHQLDAVIQTSAAEGMQSMDRTLTQMVQGGLITYDEAKNYAVDLTEFERMMRVIMLTFNYTARDTAANKIVKSTVQGRDRSRSCKNVDVSAHSAVKDVTRNREKRPAGCYRVESFSPRKESFSPDS